MLPTEIATAVKSNVDPNVLTKIAENTTKTGQVESLNYFSELPFR